MRKVRMRKMIALLLAAVMAFSLVIVTGAAEETDTPETSQQTVKLIVKKTVATTTGATYEIYLDASACDGVAALQFKLVPAVGMTQGTVKLESFDTQFNVPEAGSSAYTENGGQYGYTDNTGMYVAFGGDVSKNQCIKENVLVMTIPYTFDETVTPSLTVAADSFKACKSGNDALMNPYNCAVEYEDATATPTPSTGIKGDVNGDGEINTDDLTALARIVAGIDSVSDSHKGAADVTGDGNVDTDDLTKMARYMAGIISSFEQE